VEPILHFFASFVAVLLDAVSFAMFIRMLLSLLFDSEDSRISVFLACITEPFIIPIRYLMVKFNILQNSPIDWSFTVSYLVIVVLRFLLPVI